ncbi:quinone oxidoreductase [Cladochytrium replicatum]|nr:quinone oxidoreductase [Cladochytrium replicatum]
MVTMQAIVVKVPGGASQLATGDVKRPVPKPTDILVRVHAFGVNRLDILQRSGNYPPPPGASELLGVEFAGVIEELGAEVLGFSKGERVASLVGGGAYAEYAVVDYRLAFALPKSLTFEVGASIPENWMTAYKALFYSCQIKAGDDVLIHAGASGVGCAAIQLAKLVGARKIIVTAGSQDKIDRCFEWGATHGINYKKEQFANKVSEITDGKGVDCLVDFVGGDYWDANLAALGMDGRMVMLGFLGGAAVHNTNISPILRKRLTIQGSTLRSRDLGFQSELKDKIVTEVLPHIVSGKLKVVIDTVYPWTDIQEAHKRMESNSNVGKIVVVVN